MSQQKDFTGKIAEQVTDAKEKLEIETGRLLGIDNDRRYECYLSIARSSNPFEVNYWLEIIFSFGIATLGLVLNSPAVIIGAMLISPLMGPILGMGLSLATGDVFLGTRSLLNILASIVLAVGGSAILVHTLPFKELTPEILSRIQPNALDLGVAILCGFAASFATLRSTKGLVAAIPGVAIAVALMPPLAVVGYGLGIRGSLPVWLEVVKGGGLLFAANFVAIIFTSMVVFLVVRMNAKSVRRKVDEWQRKSYNQTPLEHFLNHTKIWKVFEKVGTFQARLLLAVVFLLLVFQPLYRSMVELKNHISLKRHKESENKVLTQLAQEVFGKSGLSEVEKVSVLESLEGIQVVVYDRVSQLISNDEKYRFEEIASKKIQKPVKLTLVQIPTSFGNESGNDWAALFGLNREIEEKQVIPPVSLRDQLLEILTSLWPSQRADLVDFSIQMKQSGSTHQVGGLGLTYLADTKLSEDAMDIVRSHLHRHLDATVDIAFHWIPRHIASWNYRPGKADLSAEAQSIVEKISDTLNSHSNLSAILRVEAGAGDPASKQQDIVKNRSDYLKEKFETLGVDMRKLEFREEIHADCGASLEWTLESSPLVDNPSSESLPSNSPSVSEKSNP
ncbi:MAG: TIGR00341 family protein [Deltaproteobacteria bacterium]|nr:TIGR00341 family protein [Deltaproteobacteria bacterium]